MASNQFMNPQPGDPLQSYNMPISDPNQPVLTSDPNQPILISDQLQSIEDPNQMPPMSESNITKADVDELKNLTKAAQQPGIFGTAKNVIIAKVLGGIVVVALMGLLLWWLGSMVKAAYGKAFALVKGGICDSLGSVIAITGSDFCDAGPGTIVDPETTNANYIFQTYGNNDKLFTYEVPGDGRVWYKPANGIKTDDIELLDYDGGSNNSGDKPEYHGIEFKDKDDSIFKNSVNTNASNTCDAGCGNTQQSKVFGLTGPKNGRYEKEPKYLYRKQKGPDYVYAVFKRKDFTPTEGIPNFIFITLNSDGGEVKYAVPEDSMWTDPAYKNIKTNNVESLTYDETYNGTSLVGIQFKNNNESIFRNSENDNKFNSFNTGGKNNGQSVAKIAAPKGYEAESKYLYREKQGGDYIYKVFRRTGFVPPEVSSNDIAGDKNANYMLGTINSDGQPKYYAVPGDGADWYKPAIYGEKTDAVEKLNYGEQYNDKYLPGVQFKNNGDSIFKLSSNDNPDNSFNTGGKNNGQSVAVMNPPSSKYAKEEKYAYREKQGGDYVYAVFRKKDFTPPNAVVIKKDDGSTVVVGPPKHFIVTCGSTTYMNPNYIFQTVNKKGEINTYPITDDNYWTNPSNDIVRTRDYEKDGIRGIEFHNNSDSIFRCSTNDDSDNSYGTSGTNNMAAVTNLAAPLGYEKESKYLWRRQSGPNYLYAVFKKKPVDCSLYNTNLPYECMNKIWKAAGCKKDTPWSDRPGQWASDKSRATLESDVKLYLNAESCTGVAPPSAPGAPSKPARFTDIKGGSDTKYILGNVNSRGEKKFYAINDDNFWKNPNKSDVDTFNYKKDGKTGTIFENNGNTIFKNSNNENDDNSYGDGGKNTYNAVYNMTAPEGYTKEDSYAWRWQSGRNYIYAVFKRNDTFTADKVISRFMNRGNLKPMFY